MLTTESKLRRGAFLASALVLACAVCGSPDTAPPPPPPPPGPPASLSIAPPSVQLGINQTAQLTATVRDAGGQTIPGATVAWASDQPAVASVANGLVTGVAVGHATITATSGPASGTAAVDVSAAPPPAPMQVGFATFLGGAQNDLPRDVAFDGAGNAYITGGTRSADFPTTQGAYDRVYGGGSGEPADAFVAKFSPAGGLIWSTYLGATEYERAYAIEVDPHGDVIIAGRGGAGLPVGPNVFQPTFAGGNSAYGPQDGFVCKLAGTGQSVRWCSYFGVGDAGIIRDVAVDANGDVFVAGWTDQGGFPSSWFTGTVQPTKAAGQDAIVAKIAGDGSRVIWATYLGGSAEDGGGPVVRIDPQDNPVIGFDTQSPDLPVVNGPQPYHGGRDLYVVKLSADGRQRLFAGYLGGSGDELTETHGLWLDPQGNAVVIGHTKSADLPTTAGVVQPQFGGTGDMIVAKVSPAGALLALTYLGGPADEGGEGVVTDASGNVYLSGYATGSFLSTGGGSGLADAVVVSLTPGLNAVRGVIRRGGSDNDSARSIAIDGQGNLVVIGQTSSANWPVVRAFQSGYHGAIDGLVLRLTP